MKTRIPFAVGAALAALLLASCSGPPADEPSRSAAPTPTAPTPTVTSTPVAEPDAEPDAPPTCETIISQGTVEALTAQGWTWKQEEFRIGETVLDEGILCMWSDFSTASDHGQMYAWAPIEPAAADAAKSGLTKDGWLRSGGEEVTYFTEDPAYAIATDEDGFGMTYEFGDGWVKFADTKQGLLLIEWPG